MSYTYVQGYGYYTQNMADVIYLRAGLRLLHSTNGRCHILTCRVTVTTLKIWPMSYTYVQGYGYYTQKMADVIYLRAGLRLLHSKYGRCHILTCRVTVTTLKKWPMSYTYVQGYGYYTQNMADVIYLRAGLRLLHSKYGRCHILPCRV